MSVAFRRGSTTGPNDLSITIRDVGGNLIDPYRLEYAVYDRTTGLEVLIGSPVNIPTKTSLGRYYAEVVIAGDSNIGDWLIRWTIQEYASDPVYQSVQEFNVVGDNTVVSFTGNVNLDRLLYRLRILLRDNNPDRNYSFRTPAKEKFIQGQTQVFGFIWEDEELLEYLYMAVDEFNGRPPVTGISIDKLWTTEQRWKTTILLRAAAFACFAIAMNWVADEFSVGGEELLALKTEDGEVLYITIEEFFDLIYGEKLNKIKETVKRETRELIKEFRKDEFLAPSVDSDPEQELKGASSSDDREKIRSSFLKGKLLVKSMVQKGPISEWRPVSDVLRHDTLHKNLFRIRTDIGEVVVTEDHSLFRWPDKDPVEASLLKPGDLIVGAMGWYNNTDQDFKPVKVLSIVSEEKRKHTYDLSVPGAENFVLDSGVLVHNSYSISGVSLDIEKSSKYQSMKDEFIAEFDKDIEANKRSIKLIVGLRQAKYGIGIQSSLGPLSRPGVQSRRNFVESGRPMWV